MPMCTAELSSAVERRTRHGTDRLSHSEPWLQGYSDAFQFSAYPYALQASGYDTEEHRHEYTEGYRACQSRYGI